MKPIYLCLCGAFFIASTINADVKITPERVQDGTGAFKFTNVPSPRRSDAGTKAVFTLIDGERDRNGGDLDKLHDGRLPRNADDPGSNFFFRAGTDGGRLLVDLGAAIDLKEVNTFSWHGGTRGPQVYRLYASDGKAENFAAQPKRPADPATVGWKLVTA